MSTCPACKGIDTQKTPLGLWCWDCGDYTNNKHYRCEAPSACGPGDPEAQLDNERTARSVSW